MSSLGRTWTTVVGARTREQFLSGLKRGRTAVAGESGDYGKLTGTVFDIGRSLMKEHPWALALAPLAALIPAVTLGNLLWETWFANKWGRLQTNVPTGGGLLTRLDEA
jgi:hypothetical protein